MSTNPFASAEKVNAIIKIRRGPDSDRINSIYDSGELIYTTDKKRVYVGDGNNAVGTYGGNIVGNKAWVTDNFAKLNNVEIGDTVYRIDTSSYYVLTGSSFLLESSYVLVGGNNIITQNISNGTVPKATKSTLGVIKVGADLAINTDGTLNLPKATTSILGGVKVGTGLSAADDGTLSISGGAGSGGGSTYILSAATTSKLGGVIVGKGLSADNTGKLSLSAIPETASSGQILTWNGTKWVASDPSTLGVGGDAIPIGSVMYFASSSIPIGYLECDGRVVDRSKYADLDTAIYCGDVNNATAEFGYRRTLLTSSTPRSPTGKYLVLPDLRGEFIRGWDHVTSDDNRQTKIDINRKFGSFQKGSIMGYDQEGDAVWNVSSESKSIAGQDTQPIMGVDDYIINDYVGVKLTGITGNSAIVLKGTTTNSGGAQGYTGITRPRNIALVACIKALKTGAPSVINYIPRPATADDGQVLTYQRSNNSWVAGSSTNQVYRDDFFIYAHRPNENNLVNAINDEYADGEWKDIKKLTKLSWEYYFGTKNPKSITVGIYTSEIKISATVGQSLGIFFDIPNFFPNKAINGTTKIGEKQYFFNVLNNASDDKDAYSTNTIWLNEDGTAYLKIEKTDPKTFGFRIFILGATF